MDTKITIQNSNWLKIEPEYDGKKKALYFKTYCKCCESSYVIIEKDVFGFYIRCLVCEEVCQIEIINKGGTTK